MKDLSRILGGGGLFNDNIKHEYFECNTDYTRLFGGGGGGVMITLNMNILNVKLITQVIGEGGGGKDIIKHVYFECNTGYTRSFGGGG